MNTTQELIEQVKQLTGARSDYAVAKRMGWSTSKIGNYRTGRSQLDVDSCFAVAELLGKDPAAIIAAVEAERATKPEAREAWIQRLKQLGGVAATVLITTSGALPAPGNAAVAAHDNGACHRQPLTVFRTRRAYAARCRSAMSRVLDVVFQHLRRPAFAAPALA